MRLSVFQGGSWKARSMVMPQISIRSTGYSRKNTSKSRMTYKGSSSVTKRMRRRSGMLQRYHRPEDLLWLVDIGPRSANPARAVDRILLVGGVSEESITLPLQSSVGFRIFSSV